MTDEDIIRNAGIMKALIVDDCYDLIPTPDDMADADWDIFFDDAKGERADNIEKYFSGFNPEKRSDLRSSSKFISAIWNNKDKLENEIGNLFENYMRKSNADLIFIKKVEKIVRNLNIEFDKCGKKFIDKAAKADLVIIDLFLGTAQNEGDRERTVDGLREVLKRVDDPPIVILMSQIPLNDRASVLRDEVELHASGFDSIQKQNIDDPGRLSGMIVTLALHRSDSRSLARFTKSWEASAKAAVKRSAGELRKIDIDDLHYIRYMLLSSEGIHPSGYLIDVFDRVLQYEIESDRNVLETAKAIDEVGSEAAPLQIAQEKDSYRLIRCLQYINPKRRDHHTGSAWPITFGDIIVSKNRKKVSKNSIFNGDVNRVFFVASPECDFVRGSNKLTTALLIAGNLDPLKMGTSALTDQQARPILDLENDERFQVCWDFGLLESITLRRANYLLANEGPGYIAGTMRDVNALNLRQKFLNHFGRIGLLATPPLSSELSITCMIPQKKGPCKNLMVGESEKMRGTMFVNREGKKAHIVLDRSHEADLASALAGLNMDDIAKNSLGQIQKLREQRLLLREICRTGFRNLNYPLIDKQDGRLQRVLNSGGNSDNKLEKVGKIFFDDGKGEIDLNKCDSFGLIIRISIN